ncbi:Hypothetical predicted protein [Mytilus galloprovincialis]|uniref:Uncharacterized protein n=1 Tax=Mytilus galloprovincialis TaxID=29158 RepID=A0A8B6DVS0_MYTGA|nr:Hypothetical predicted protein [Mytilus galloprovincialis]
MSCDWIPRESNTKADKLSRQSDCDDWGIQSWVFEYLNDLWGIFTCDRFACDYNTKCKMFNSKFYCKGTSGIDAFKQNWTNENNWLVPPPSLITKVINKLTVERCEGTLVVPEWRSAPYWCLKINEHVEAAVLESGVTTDSPLYQLYPKMCKLLLGSRSDNTIKSYFYAFRRWEQYITKLGFAALPAQPIHIALYFTHLLDQGSTFHPIDNAKYGIKWAHEINGLTDPTENSFVSSIQEAAKRTAYKTVTKKEPVTTSTDMLIQLCEKYSDSEDLLIVRDLTMTLLGFAGFFLRYDELSSLLFSNVKVKDDFLVLYLNKSKTDQYRQGNEVLISKGFSVACPFNMYLKYVRLAGFVEGSEMFLFRPVFRSGNTCKLIYKNKKA